MSMWLLQVHEGSKSDQSSKVMWLNTPRSVLVTFLYHSFIALPISRRSAGMQMQQQMADV